MKPIKVWEIWIDGPQYTDDEKIARQYSDNPREGVFVPRADFDALVKERDEAREALAEERASRYPCNGPGELWRPLAMDDGPPRLYIFQRKRIDESDTPPSYMEISEEDGTLLLHYVKHGEADDSIIVECGADLPLRKMAEAARGDLDAATARADKAETERDAMNAQYEAAMEVIHRNAGARRDGLCGILAWIDRAKDAVALLREAYDAIRGEADFPLKDRIKAFLMEKANG